MSIRINLDELFNPTDLHSDTDQSYRQDSCYGVRDNFAQPQVEDCKYYFSTKIFDEQLCELSNIMTPAERGDSTVQTNHSSNRVRAPRGPGERLFYEAQMNQLRKIKQRQRIQQQSLTELKKVATFAPCINENSKKLAEQQRRLQQGKWQMQKGKKIGQVRCKKNESVRSTKELEEEKQLKQCTFRPQLSYNQQKKTRERGKNAFEQLYEDHKMKQLRRKMQAVVLDSDKDQAKKMGRDQIEQFVRKHKEYAAKISRKQQLLKCASERYDLTTGHKLFSPKIQSVRMTPSGTSSSQSSTPLRSTVKGMESPMSKSSGIFNKKKYDSLAEQEYAGEQLFPEQGLIKSRKCSQGNVFKQTKHEDEIKRVTKFDFGVMETNEEHQEHNEQQSQEIGNEIEEQLEAYLRENKGQGCFDCVFGECAAGEEKEVYEQDKQLNEIDVMLKDLNDRKGQGDEAQKQYTEESNKEKKKKWKMKNQQQKNEERENGEDGDLIQKPTAEAGQPSIHINPVLDLIKSLTPDERNSLQ